jgi:hypothetical protein
MVRRLNARAWPRTRIHGSCGSGSRSLARSQSQRSDQPDPAGRHDAGAHLLGLLSGDAAPRRRARRDVSTRAQRADDVRERGGPSFRPSSLSRSGFGAKISGDLPEVLQVARARDLEGREREWVRTDRDGTRHRSAYRLCQAVRDALALVVSQDGGFDSFAGTTGPSRIGSRWRPGSGKCKPTPVAKAVEWLRGDA